MIFTVSELGVLFLLLFVLFHWLGIMPKLRAVLAFVGTVIVGSSGFIGGIVTDVGSWAQNTFGSITNWALGVPLAAGLAIVLGVILVHDLHPKKPAGKRTGYVAVALGALVVVGVAGIPALAGLHNVILSLVGNAQAALSSATGA
jgi:hypothetical protein